MFFFFMSPAETAQIMLGHLRDHIKGLEEQISGLNKQLAAARAAEGTILASSSEDDLAHGLKSLDSANAIRVSAEELAVVAEKPKLETNEQAVLRYATAVLTTAQYPLDRHDLLVRFKALGFTPSVVDPAKFIGKTLWKSAKFIHHKGDLWRGYWLANRQLPTPVDVG